MRGLQNRNAKVCPCLKRVTDNTEGNPGSSDSKESACNAENPGSIPGLGRCPGGGHGNPLQYSCLEYPMNRGPWWATVQGFPVNHQLLKLAQTHVHQVCDAIQPSHLLSSPSPPALNLFQHQSLFQGVSSSHQVAKVLAVTNAKHTCLMLWNLWRRRNYDHLEDNGGLPMWC